MRSGGPGVSGAWKRCWASSSPTSTSASTASAPSSSRNGSLLALGRGEVLQDEVGGVLPAGRAADADAHAQVVLGAERLRDRAQPVVAALAAALLEPDVAGGMSSSSWMTTRRSAGTS